MSFLNELSAFLSYSLFDVSLGRITLALFIFFLVYFLRQLISNFGIKFLKKFTVRTKTDLDDKLLNLIEAPVKFLFIIIGLWAAVEILQLPEESTVFINRIIRSLFAYVIIWTAYRATDILSGFLRKVAMKTETGLDDHLVIFVGKFLRIGVVIIGVMILVREWNYDITGLVAGLGLGGLAFALAARDTVANLFGSITILVDRPFVLGDWIETPHVEGTIEDIQLRSTQIRTFSHALVTIPNSTLANDPITNWSRMGKRRIKFSLGVTYSSTREQVEVCGSRILEMLKSHPDIHPETIFVYFTDFGDSALEYFLYFFTKTIKWEEYLRIRQDVNLKIMSIIEELGMNIAFPSQSLYLEKMKPDEIGHISEQVGNNPSKKGK